MKLMHTNKLSTRSKLLVFAAAALMSVTAAASSGGVALALADQYCALGGSACLNAWNGGPAVDVEGPGATNNSFATVPSATSGDVNIENFDGGPFNEQCIGDFTTGPNDARAGIVGGCGTTGIGWGGNFIQQNCTDSQGNAGVKFKNVHWGGWLGPNGSTNGSAFYLNKPTPYCFTIRGF